MTVRLSHRSFTGTERTEVAVGTVSETSMFWAVRAGAPRSTVYDGSSLAAAGSGGRDSLGTGFDVPLAGSAALASGRGLATGAGVRVAAPGGVFSSGLFVAGGPLGVLASGVAAGFAAGAGAALPWGFASVLAGAAEPLAAPFALPDPLVPWSLK